MKCRLEERARNEDLENKGLGTAENKKGYDRKTINRVLSIKRETPLSNFHDLMFRE